MVGERLADRQVDRDLDAVAAQLGGRADPREHQDLRRLDEAAAEDDAVGPEPPRLPAGIPGFHPDRPTPVEEDPVDRRLGVELEVGPVADRSEVDDGGAGAPRAFEVAGEGPDAGGVGSVGVLADREATLESRLLEGAPETRPGLPRGPTDRDRSGRPVVW